MWTALSLCSHLSWWSLSLSGSWHHFPCLSGPYCPQMPRNCCLTLLSFPPQLIENVTWVYNMLHRENTGYNLLCYCDTMETAWATWLLSPWKAKMLMNNLLLLHVVVTTASFCLHKMPMCRHMEIGFKNFHFNILPLHNIVTTLVKFSSRRLQRMKKKH